MCRVHGMGEIVELGWSGVSCRWIMRGNGDMRCDREGLREIKER